MLLLRQITAYRTSHIAYRISHTAYRIPHRAPRIAQTADRLSIPPPLVRLDGLLPAGMGAVNSKAGDAGALYLRDQTRCKPPPRSSSPARPLALLTLACSLRRRPHHHQRPQPHAAPRLAQRLPRRPLCRQARAGRRRPHRLRPGPRRAAPRRWPARLPAAPAQRRRAALPLHLCSAPAPRRPRHLHASPDGPRRPHGPRRHPHPWPDVCLCLERARPRQSRHARVPRQPQPPQEPPGRAGRRLLHRRPLVGPVPVVVEMDSAPRPRVAPRRLAHQLQCV